MKIAESTDKREVLPKFPDRRHSESFAKVRLHGTPGMTVIVHPSADALLFQQELVPLGSTFEWWREKEGAHLSEVRRRDAPCPAALLRISI